MRVALEATIHHIDVLDAVQLASLTTDLQRLFPGSTPSVCDNDMLFDLESDDHARAMFQLETLIVHVARSYSPELWLSVAIKPAG